VPTNHAIKDLLLVMCCSRFDESKLHCNTAFRAKQLREVENFSLLSDKQNEAIVWSASLAQLLAIAKRAVARWIEMSAAFASFS